MPEQQSARAQAVTRAEFTAPFETPTIPLGIKGLNLTQDQGSLESGEYQLLSNAAHRADFALTSRNGLGTAFATTTPGEAHSVMRLTDPEHSTYTGIYGVGTVVYRGQGGALTSIEGGWSGDPLWLTPNRTTLGVGAWMTVADRSKMRQIRVDGLSRPLGMPAPTVALTTLTAVVKPKDQLALLAFGSADGTAGGNFADIIGADFSVPPLPTLTPIANDGVSPTGTAVEFVTVPGTLIEAAGKGYYTYWSHALSKNWTELASGTEVDDEDFIHLFLKLSHAQLTQEVRIYFVCAATFDPLVLPGTSGDANQDYYVHAFPQNDYAAYLQSQASLRAATQQAADSGAAQIAGHYEEFASSRNAAIKQRRWVPTQPTLQGIPISAIAKPQPGSTKAPSLPGVQPLLTGSLQLPGDSSWLEYGVINRPLRRSDWQRGGTTTGRDWSTITGVIVYVQATPDTFGPIAVSLSDMYVYGGVGIDSADASSLPYDWRYTNKDLRTGDEGNPSPEMIEGDFVDTARTRVGLTPAAYGTPGDTNIVQLFYRRGGTLNGDWTFDGQNASDGGEYVSFESDDALSETGSLALDHYEAIPTVAADGSTVLAQPVACVFGPYNGLVFAVGDPYRPGHVAWCIPEQPGHWPATYNHQVCASSEELMAGAMFGGSPYVFSRERGYVLYPSSGQEVVMTSAPTSCRRGLISHWGICVTTRGIVGVAKDGLFLTTGGGAEKLISDDIEALFRGLTVREYLPIDKDVPNAIRLTEISDELYFQYQDTDGDRQVMVYNWPGDYWRHYHWESGDGAALAADEGDTTARLLVGSRTTGAFWAMSPDWYHDEGAAISVRAQTRADDYGRPREEKLFGDQYLELNRQDVDITLQNTVNADTITNPVQVLAEGIGRVVAIFDAFGTEPQHARTIATLMTWTSAIARPFLYKLGVAIVQEPELTINRVTAWDDLGHPDEKYMTGVTFDCDTGGVDRTILIEADLLGVITTIATLTVNHDGRHKKGYSWPGVNAQMVRVRPTGECVAWMLFRADWIFAPEPPRVAGWDVYFENAWDHYHTGLDLYCNTYGATKTVEVYVDEVLIGTYSVVTVGRKVVHITLPWGRGHVYHFVATDANLGTLFSHRWQMVDEPSEQTNWNQNFSTVGTLADKWFKAFLFEVDTFGQDKTVTIELDGTVVDTLGVNTNGRKVVQMALSPQRLGRVLRVFPTDGYPSRPYTIQPVFDIEPLALTRWETQEEDDGLPGYKEWLWAAVTLVSTADVTLTMAIQRSHTGTGAVQTLTYTIPSTVGVKLERYVPFQAAKGVKRKYVLTSASAFRLYSEESAVAMLGWGAQEYTFTHPFGNDDIDRPTRDMIVAERAAARPGGN